MPADAPSRRLLAWVLLALVTVACGSIAPTSQPSADPTPLFAVETRGGECPQEACGSVVVVGRDGRVRRVQAAPTTVVRAEAAVVARVAAVIAVTDFAALRSRPFTGECPTAFDGQETVYTFFVAGVEERIASCEVEIPPDHPLFVELNGLLAQTVSR